MTLLVTILTPSRLFWDGEAFNIELPTAEGQLSINQKGVISLTNKEGESKLVVPKEKKNESEERLFLSETGEFSYGKTDPFNPPVFDNIDNCEKVIKLSIGISVIITQYHSTPFVFFGGYVLIKEQVVIILAKAAELIEKVSPQTNELFFIKALSDLKKAANKEETLRAKVNLAIAKYRLESFEE